MRVLVIEDEKKVASFIAKGFGEEGYAADVVHDGETGARQAIDVDYDLVVLDLMLPKLSGLQVLRTIRQKKSKLPVLILTAKGSLEDRISGLDAGADDYLVKPFAFAELSARVRAVLRRGSSEDTKLRAGDLEMNTATRVVKRRGQTIDLKLKEYALLEFLLRNLNRPVTRTMITEHVWDIHFDSISNVVDVHINSLRNKIDRGFSFPLIRTIRGVGYMLSDTQP
jgi:DNA-binding response OmpR family regulator